MGMAKVTHVRQALEQICSDARNPRTMCARIMAEHGVTIRDVLDACDMARDVVLAWRESPHPAQAVPMQQPAQQTQPTQATQPRPQSDRHEGLNAALAALRGKDG